MPRQKLNQKVVGALEPEAKLKWYFDTALPSFCVRVSPTGTKSFCLFYYRAGRQRLYTIGSFPVWTVDDARTEAMKIKLAVDQGKDPGAEKKAQRQAQKRQREELPETFGEIADDYIERYAKKNKRSWKEDDRIIKAYLNPRFEKIPAAEIKRAEVRRLLDDMADDAPVMANRVLAAIRKIFNWAIEKELVEHNPCVPMERPGGKEKKRDRILKDDEIRKVWAAAGKENALMFGLFKLLLLTLKRSGETRKMRWTDIDFEKKTWDIPAEHSKSKIPDLVPLSPMAVRVLKDLRQDAENNAKKFKRQIPEWVFPNPRNRKQHLLSVQTFIRRVRTNSNIPHWTGHDLRRTARSHMGQLGVSREIAEKLMAHKEPEMIATYDRFDYLDQKRVALDKWAKRLTMIVSNLKAVPSLPQNT